VFIGHFALGFAAKRAAPPLSLAVLFVAAQFADLLWPVLLAAGVESVRIAPGNTAFTPLDFISYPWSHSLLLLVIWGLALGTLVQARTSVRHSLALITALVVSHWLLDWLTHRPDMPLYPGGAKIGLGLWNSVSATVMVELTMLAAGLAVYARATRPRDAAGRWGLVAFVVFLLIVYAANLLGPPPPSIRAIWMLGVVGGAALTAWSWWFDRHRMATER
jgi:hypothetical protein